ncbi:hypothetical protein POPTR_001G115067v4 [Populus trichocarpa]|uniref:Uncharacterized protein n=1 Tax=Populus trichocarpa TaxID=3694 RepID=A0A3N7E948_POPTR|nr:hypothetical protein POPTR_001G115067v4 [Populus trichocarpa]
MLFYLTILNLKKFLTEEAPNSLENESDPITVVNYTLNKLDNTSYDVYTLDKKYKAKDTDMKKFIVGKFLDLKIVDSRTVMNQVQKFQLILHDKNVKDMSLNFKNHLKYKHKKMIIKDLVLRLRIEDDNKLFEKRINSSKKSHNKNKKKLGVKGKRIAKKFNGKCFIYNKIVHLVKDYINKGKKANPKKKIAQANVTNERV